MKLIVGLGNPGKEYVFTRHNVGFRVIDVLGLRWNIPLMGGKFLSLLGRGKFFDHEVILVKPQTFMNRSGEAVPRLLNYFGLELKDLIIVHDDMDLELGIIKIKRKGGHGGHKGIESIIEILGDEEFLRVKVGIGHPKREEVVPFLLEPFSIEEEAAVEQMIQRAADAVESLLIQGVERAISKCSAISRQLPNGYTL